MTKTTEMMKVVIVDVVIGRYVEHSALMSLIKNEIGFDTTIRFKEEKEGNRITRQYILIENPSLPLKAMIAINKNSVVKSISNTEIENPY